MPYVPRWFSFLFLGDDILYPPPGKRSDASLLICFHNTPGGAAAEPTHCDVLIYYFWVDNVLSGGLVLHYFL